MMFTSFGKSLHRSTCCLSLCTLRRYSARSFSSHHDEHIESAKEERKSSLAPELQVLSKLASTLPCSVAGSIKGSIEIVHFVEV